MNYEIAMKWCEALKSGKYKQGYGELRINDKYCCLGVLCDISEQGKWEKCDKLFKYGQYYSNVLPASVMRWAEMKSSAGKYSTDLNDSFDVLWYLNDSLKWSFEQIADFIEKNWEKL